MEIKEEYIDQPIDKKPMKYYKKIILNVFFTIISGWFAYQAYDVFNISAEYLGYFDWKEALIKPMKLCLIYTIPIVLTLISQFYLSKKLKRNFCNNDTKVKSFIKTIKSLKNLTFIFLLGNLFILGFYYILYSDLYSLYTYKEYTPNEIRKIAIHEASHCIINENEFPNTTIEIRIFDKKDYENVDKYIGRNLTSQLPEGIHLSNQSDLYTKTHVYKLIKVNLAGVIAEELLSEDKMPTLGAKSDFDKVEELVMALVENGQTYLGATSWNLLTTNERKKVYDEIVNPLYIETKSEVLDNKDRILELSNVLSEKRNLNNEEILDIISED